jgi:DNA-binding GntR family transcriptional regulator
MTTIEPSVPFRTKTDAVYSELRTRILEGTIEPASTLNQGQLASQLGVSTTPLREAIRRLESEGLVRSINHRLVEVAPLDIAELAALYEVREELDAFAVRLAALRHTEEERDGMLDALGLISDPSIDADSDTLKQNRRFHATIYRASHNPVLIELLDSLWDRADRYRRAGVFLARDVNVLSEHRAIVDAVIGRRAEEAEQLMREHLRHSSEAIERHIAGDRPAG